MDRENLHEEVSVEEIEKRFYYDPAQREISERELFSRYASGIRWSWAAFAGVFAILALLYVLFFR